eukprot:CAMPEP_0202896286 /NCGR_PEP_ID=MMETSP1392-20130828/5318_1 /ASSEMBLY_ACC=CAM_ASM_000868 /TAXON_ID=225041 /ORGANISM="Chlamydomonas chlamydogama, Strain SAG 11-48b" /LENGTH=1485 /DNA_ID=CAMNT_0049581583 /DNA_START=292 /DNA_END=4749 /DNA_ORIENTATION=-
MFTSRKLLMGMYTIHESKSPSLELGARYQRSQQLWTSTGANHGPLSLTLGCTASKAKRRHSSSLISSSLPKPHHLQYFTKRHSQAKAASIQATEDAQREVASVSADGPCDYSNENAPEWSVRFPSSAQETVAKTRVVRFIVPEFVTSPGQCLALVGSGPVLGNWDASRAVRMSWQEGHKWVAEVHLNHGWRGAYEFKLVLIDGPCAVWEPGSNRLLVVDGTTPEGKPMEVTCCWGSCAGMPPTPVRVVPAGHADTAECTIAVPNLPISAKSYAAGGLEVVLTGNKPQLGNWDPSKGVRLKPTSMLQNATANSNGAATASPLWTAVTRLPLGKLVEAKVVILDQGQPLQWEGGCNRTILLNAPIGAEIRPPAAVTRAGAADVEPSPAPSAPATSSGQHHMPTSASHGSSTASSASLASSSIDSSFSPGYQSGSSSGASTYYGSHRGMYHTGAPRRNSSAELAELLGVVDSDGEDSDYDEDGRPKNGLATSLSTGSSNGSSSASNGASASSHSHGKAGANGHYGNHGSNDGNSLGGSKAGSSGARAGSSSKDMGVYYNNIVASHLHVHNDSSGHDKPSPSAASSSVAGHMPRDSSFSNQNSAHGQNGHTSTTSGYHNNGNGALHSGSSNHNGHMDNGVHGLHSSAPATSGAVPLHAAKEPAGISTTGSVADVASPSNTIGGDFVVLLHWNATSCSQVVYRPLVEAPEHGSLAHTTAATSMVHFTVPHFITHPGQHLVVTGAVSELGSWNASQGVQLKWGPGHRWTAGVELPLAAMEAKIVLYSGGQYVWEPTPNRKLDLDLLVSSNSPTGAGDVYLSCDWGAGPSTAAVVVPQPPPAVVLEVAAEDLDTKGSSSSSSSAAKSQEQQDKRTTVVMDATGTHDHDTAVIRLLSFIVSSLLFKSGGEEDSAMAADQQKQQQDAVVRLQEAVAAKQHEVEELLTQLAQQNAAARAAVARQDALEAAAAAARAEAAGLRVRMISAEDARHAEVDAASSRHQADLAAVRQMYESRILDIQRQYEARILDLQQHEARIIDLQQQHEAIMAGMQQQHAQVVADLESRLASTVRHAEQQATVADDRHQRQLRDAQQQVQRNEQLVWTVQKELLQAKEDHTQEVADLQASTAADRLDMEKAHAAHADKLETQHSAAVQELRAKLHADAIEHQRTIAELVKQHAEKTQAVEQSKKEEVTAMQAQLEASVAAHGASVADIRQQNEASLSALTDTLARARQQHAAQVRGLERRGLVLAEAVAARQVELDQLRVQLKETIAAQRRSSEQAQQRESTLVTEKEEAQARVTEQQSVAQKALAHAQKLEEEGAAMWVELEGLRSRLLEVEARDLSLQAKVETLREPARQAADQEVAADKRKKAPRGSKKSGAGKTTQATKSTATLRSTGPINAAAAALGAVAAMGNNWINNIVPGPGAGPQEQMPSSGSPVLSAEVAPDTMLGGSSVVLPESFQLEASSAALFAWLSIMQGALQQQPPDLDGTA